MMLQKENMTGEHTEEELIHFLKQGHEWALWKLFEKHRPRMLFEAYYIIRSNQEAEDVVQEIFIRLWNGRDKLALHSSLATYLVRATRYEIIHKLKKNVAQQKKLAQYNYFQDETIEMHPFENKELADRLHAAIQSIPAAAREAFLSFYIDKKRQKTIAEEQNVSLQAVKNNIGRAIRMLRTKLQLSLEN